MNESMHAIPYLTDLNDSDPMLNTRHGVFYPKGFNVIAYPDPEALTRAWQQAWESAVTNDGARAIDSAQMQSICDRSDEQATTAATMAAAELKQTEIFRQIADRGGVFLIINDDAIDREPLARALENHRPVKALRYGLLTIEELVPQDDSMLEHDPLGANEQGRD